MKILIATALAAALAAPAAFAHDSNRSSHPDWRSTHTHPHARWSRDNWQRPYFWHDRGYHRGWRSHHGRFNNHPRWNDNRWQHRDGRRGDRDHRGDHDHDWNGRG